MPLHSSFPHRFTPAFANLPLLLAIVACSTGPGTDALVDGSGGNGASGGGSGGGELGGAPGTGGSTNSGGVEATGGSEASGGAEASTGGANSGGMGGEGGSDSCAGVSCQNDGVCESDGGGDYHCACAAEFTGDDCSLARLQLTPEFIPYDMTPDGAVVVGHSDSTGIAYINGEREELKPLVGDIQARAYATSDDGAIIVGISVDDPPSGGFAYTPVIWEDGVITALPVPDDRTNCHATDVSADGYVIVGTCSSSGTEEFPSDLVVRWLGGVLDELPGADDWCGTARVSGDGAAVFSTCNGPSTPFRAAMWTASGGPSPLPGGADNCFLYSISMDGLSGVGACYDSSWSSVEGLRWTAGEGFDVMTDAWLLEADAESSAWDMSDDGAFTVGTATESGDRVGVRWNASGTPERLSDLLSAAGIDTTGSTFDAVGTTSATGQILTASGVDDGSSATWIVRLD